MGKIYIFILSILVVACNGPEKQGVHKDLWSFTASNNNPQLDDLCTLIIKDYEGILQGLAKNDTADVFAKSKAVILRCDSLPNSFVTKDSVLLNLFKSGLLNLQDELNGLVLEQYPEELNLAMNMASIQLLHLLGSVGYTKQAVYIFNTNGKMADLEADGLLWVSLNKKSINPYYNIENELVTASYILQEN
jgi:hypothetical protein